jgi:hypothetical protein
MNGHRFGMWRIACLLGVVLLLGMSCAVCAEPLPKGKPIAILISETSGNILNPGAAVGTAEAIVKQELVAAGYPVVNEDQLAKIRRSKAAALALDGNVDAILSLGKQYGVRIFLSGKASMHTPVLNDFGFYTGTAAIAVQAYSATNGKYLFADTVTGKDMGATPDEASQKALMAAARLMAKNVMAGEGAAGAGPGAPQEPVSSTAQKLFVTIANARNFNVANQVLSACQQLPRCKDAKITGFGGGNATIEVLYMSSAKDLGDALSRKGIPATVVGISGNTVQLQAQ